MQGYSFAVCRNSSNNDINETINENGFKREFENDYGELLFGLCPIILTSVAISAPRQTPMEFNYSRVLLREQLVLEFGVNNNNGNDMICKINNAFYRCFKDNGYYCSSATTIIFNVIDNGLLEGTVDVYENSFVYDDNNNEICNGMSVLIFFFVSLKFSLS